MFSHGRLRPLSHDTIFHRDGERAGPAESFRDLSHVPTESPDRIVGIVFRKTLWCSLVPMNRRTRLILLFLLYRRRRKSRNCRLHWVHPILLKRDTVGAIKTLFEDLRKDDVKLFSCFRMSVSTFDELYKHLEKSLLRQNTKMRNCITPAKMLAVSIR
jgi:hypothetical protein